PRPRQCRALADVLAAHIDHPRAAGVVEMGQALRAHGRAPPVDAPLPSPAAGAPPGTHTPSPSEACSRFQIGACALMRSIAARAPANASSRCGAETATITLGSPSATLPTRC